MKKPSKSSSASFKNEVVSKLFFSMVSSVVVQCLLFTVLGFSFALIKQQWLPFLIPLLLVIFNIKALIFEGFLILHYIMNSMGQFDWFTKIDDHLYLGAIPLVEPHLSSLPTSLKLKAVLSINEHFELNRNTVFGPVVAPSQWPEVGVTHKQLASPDFFPPDFEILNEGSDFLNQNLSQGRPVYVHCKSGIGRSASVVIAYLMRFKKMSVHEAYANVKTARSVVFGMSSPQMKNMVKYEAYLKEFK
jgi:atypical dual specificity phosphatase